MRDSAIHSGAEQTLHSRRSGNAAVQPFYTTSPFGC